VVTPSSFHGTHKARAGTLPFSIAGFAAEARQSLAALDAALADDAAAVLLAAPADISWDEARVESVSLGLASEPTATATGGARHPQPGANAAGGAGGDGSGANGDAMTSARTVGFRPGDGGGDGGGGDGGGGGGRSSIGGGSGGSLAVATIPSSRPGASGVVSEEQFAASMAASLAHRDRRAQAEAAAPLRCIPEKKAADVEGLQKRKRRKFRTTEDIFQVTVEAKKDPATAGETATAGAATTGAAEARNAAAVAVEPTPETWAELGETMAAAAGWAADAAAGTAGASMEAPMIATGVTVAAGLDVLVSVGIHNPANPAMVMEEFLCLGMGGGAAGGCCQLSDHPCTLSKLTEQMARL
jgi:hypothetical protein